MKLEKITMLLLLFLCFSSTLLNAQTKHTFPEVGKPCPDFTLYDVLNYPKKQLSLSDFKGQYVIFDFWSKTCGACINSFPHTNQIQKLYKDSLKIVLIGYSDKENEIKPLYKKLRDKYQFNLIAGFDSTIVERLVPEGVPHLIWVDKHGIIQAITSSEDLTEDHVRNFINGQKFNFEDWSYTGMKLKQLKYNSDAPLMLDSNDTSFLFRSMLSKWKVGMARDIPGYIDVFVRSDKEARFHVLGTSLKDLYNLAYDKHITDIDIYPSPILEVRDSSLFQAVYGGDPKNLFCYSLYAPQNCASKTEMMRLMQGDLRNYFKYDAKIENRELPCYVLTVLDKSKIGRLQEKIPQILKWGKGQGGVFHDVPIENVCSIIRYDLPYKLLIINETNLTGNINIDLDAVSTNFDSVRKALNLNGLELQPSKRKMRALVIKDLN